MKDDQAVKQLDYIDYKIKGSTSDTLLNYSSLAKNLSTIKKDELTYSELEMLYAVQYIFQVLSKINWKELRKNDK